MSILGRGTKILVELTQPIVSHLHQWARALPVEKRGLLRFAIAAVSAGQYPSGYTANANASFPSDVIP